MFFFLFHLFKLFLVVLCRYVLMYASAFALLSIDSDDNSAAYHKMPVQKYLKFPIISGLSIRALKPDSLDPDPRFGFNVVLH